MKHSITINQQVIVDRNLPLDIIDAAILDTLYSFSASPSCEKMIEGQYIYCLFDKDAIARQLPLLNLSPRSVYKRIRELDKMGFIKAHPGNKTRQQPWYLITALTASLFSTHNELPSVLAISPADTGESPSSTTDSTGIDADLTYAFSGIPPMPPAAYPPSESPRPITFAAYPMPLEAYPPMPQKGEVPVPMPQKGEVDLQGADNQSLSCKLPMPVAAYTRTHADTHTPLPARGLVVSYLVNNNTITKSNSARAPFSGSDTPHEGEPESEQVLGEQAKANPRSRLNPESYRPRKSEEGRGDDRLRQACIEFRKSNPSTYPDVMYKEFLTFWTELVSDHEENWQNCKRRTGFNLTNRLHRFYTKEQKRYDGLRAMMPGPKADASGHVPGRGRLLS